MMVSSMDNWGEARTAEKLARRGRRQSLVVTAAVIVGGAIPFLAGFVDGIAGHKVVGNPDPHWMLAIVLTVLVAAAVMAARNWRDLDEFEQRNRLVRLSAVGITGLVSLPVMALVQPLVATDDIGGLTWLLMILVLVAVTIYQRRTGQS